MRCLLLALVLVGQVAAQEVKIAELQLEGCQVTDPKKVLTAINFRPVMPYDAEQLQKALMELGLFESVTLEATETPQGVRVTVKVAERTYPAPKTEDAARAINPTAVARQWLSSQQKPPFITSEQGGQISLGLPQFNLISGFEDEALRTLAASIGESDWVQKALKVAGDKTASGQMIAQLRQHLQENPDDAWARFALAYLLMAQGHYDEADQQISTLLARQSKFHPAYVLRLYAAHLRLVTFVKAQATKWVKLSPPSDFPLPPIDPTSPGVVRFTIDEGLAHFRQLPDKDWNREALLTAPLFFNNAIAGEFFLFILQASQKGDEDVDTKSVWEKFAMRSAEYLVDYLRLSRIAEQFADDLAVQKAIADWGQALLSSHLSLGFTVSFLANFPQISDPQQIPKALMTAFRSQLRVIRPYFERLRWHLERLTDKDSPYRADALNALAKCHAYLGDFRTAQRTMETALRETGKLEAQTLSNVLGLHALSENGQLTPTLVARYVAWLSELERQQSLPSGVALWLSYWRIWLEAKGDNATMWDKASKAERQAAINRLRRSAQHLPSDASNWWALGMMALALNDVPTASEALSKASELEPENKAYRYAMGLVALAQGDFKRAVELMKAMEADQ